MIWRKNFQPFHAPANNASDRNPRTNSRWNLGMTAHEPEQRAGVGNGQYGYGTNYRVLGYVGPNVVNVPAYKVKPMSTHPFLDNGNPRRVALLSVAAALTTLALKFGAWRLTGSAGLFSDAAESLVNVAASITAFTALSIAMRPADERHPFGHDKVEYFSSGVEGALIVLAAGGIVWAAVARFLDPQPLTSLGPGLVLAIVASGVNLLVARIMFQAAKRFESIALEADARHLMTDVWTTGGVVAGLSILLFAPQLTWLDPVIALLMAANIVRHGWELLRRSLDGLMDHALPPPEVRTVEECIRAAVGPEAVYHGLRTRRSGARRFVDFHLLVKGEMSVRRSHDLTVAVERELDRCLPGIQATIHVEPVEAGESFDAEKVGGLASHE